MTELANGSQGSVWRGVTEAGTPIVAIVVTLACLPEHRADFDRDLGMKWRSPHQGAANDDGEPAAPRPAPV